jgi:hypothetical protein
MIRDEVSMSLRTSTEYEIAPPLHAFPICHGGEAGAPAPVGKWIAASPVYLRMKFLKRHEADEGFGKSTLRVRDLRVFVVNKRKPIWHYNSLSLVAITIALML